MTATESSAARLQAAIDDGRRRVARGEHPVYHVTWGSCEYGAVDVAIEELPIVHLFVPGMADVLDGARVLIARTLGTDSHEFDVTLAVATAGDGG